MTPRTKRLLPLVKIANRKQEKAEIQLATSNKQLHETQTKLKQMQSYRKEYADSMTAGKISAGLLRDKQVFIQQLDQLIESLEQQIQMMSNQTQIHQQAWLEARQNTDAFDKLVEKLEQDEQHSLDLQEQNAMDDLPLRNQAYLK